MEDDIIYELTEVQLIFMLNVFYASNYEADVGRGLLPDEEQEIFRRASEFVYTEELMNVMLMIKQDTTSEEIKILADTLI